MVIFASFLHLECLELDVALRTTLVVFLGFTFEPTFKAIWMEEVSANRYTLEFLAVYKLFHADDAFFGVKLVVVYVESNIFQLGKEVLYVVLLQFFELPLH